jgi:high affinity Mn2+ porin
MKARWIPLAVLSAASLAAADDSAPADPWTIHAQSTVIEQWHYSFPSPYVGPNSFAPGEDAERTFSATLFLGYQLWNGGGLFYNPELLQGKGVGATVGIAGFPNGEAVKANYPNFHYNTSRLYFQQSVGLGGGTEKVEDDQNQFGGTRDVDRLTFTLGKFSADDFFDANAYSHDSRTQFLNWALWESAAWDYPAEALGYTAGFVAEWTTPQWALHYGFMLEPTVSNGPTLDTNFTREWGQILQFDRNYTWRGQPGTVRPFVFWNRANMGSYQDTVDTPADDEQISRTRALRSKAGVGVSWDQQVTSDLGVFSRLSWNDGRTETWAFTEIDRSAAVGASLKGSGWGRPNDILALAGVVNGLASEHRAYLAAGGTGLNLGDGALSYAPEEILETYYDVQVCQWLWVSPDYQYVEHPGYNSARGGVAIYAVRAHVEF